MTALEVRGLRSGYGRGLVLQGVDLDVPDGAVVALLGRNGVGKTTLVHTVMGMVRPRGGSVLLGGEELAGRPPHDIARRGVALVPQGRRIFSRLTVEENLAIATRGGNGAWTLDRVYDLLPRLRERRRNRGNQLSGGEQQMLAIGRALLQAPRLLLLDEPSEGLAPRLVDEIRDVLGSLRAGGLSALIVEQNLPLALGLADDVAIMVRGEIVHRSTVEEFRARPDVARRLLGLS